MGRLTRYNIAFVLVYALLLNALLPAVSLAFAPEHKDVGYAAPDSIIGICSPGGPSFIIGDELNKKLNEKSGHKTKQNCVFCISVNAKDIPLAAKESPKFKVLIEKGDEVIAFYSVFVADRLFYSIRKQAPPVS